MEYLRTSKGTKTKKKDVKTNKGKIKGTWHVPK